MVEALLGQGDGQMGLPTTGVAGKQDILTFVDKAEGGEAGDVFLVDAGLEGKVELLQPLAHRNPAELSQCRDLAFHLPGRNQREQVLGQLQRIMACAALLCHVGQLSLIDAHPQLVEPLGNLGEEISHCRSLPLM
ncbi:hypothetical protein DSECCO2_663320 [anaerobic digester metagenome]